MWLQLHQLVYLNKHIQYKWLGFICHCVTPFFGVFLETEVRQRALQGEIFAFAASFKLSVHLQRPMTKANTWWGYNYRTVWFLCTKGASSFWSLKKYSNFNFLLSCCRRLTDPVLQWGRRLGEKAMAKITEEIPGSCQVLISQAFTSLHSCQLCCLGLQSWVDVQD